MLDALAVEVEHRFAATPPRVFALLTDVERMAGLGPEHQAAHWLDAERTRFIGTNRMGDLTWDVTCVVVVHDPPHAFGWTVGEPDQPSSTWTYALVADGDGTLVRQRFVLGPGFSYLRHLATKQPERTAELAQGRAAQLRIDMLRVLEAADDLLR